MKIICIGRNFKNHAKEMNAEVPAEPLFFMKPDTALCREKDFYYPEFTQDLHHEIEVVVRISKVGKHISLDNASNYYHEIGLGIDFTARDIQKECKAKGQPWEKAKAFDNSAILGSHFMDITDLNLDSISFHLEKNGEKVQVGNTTDFIFKINEIIHYVSKFITLKTGDLIYTGTPEGVGPVQIGDRLTGYLESTQMIELNIK